jgi:hypothetical protein
VVIVAFGDRRSHVLAPCSHRRKPPPTPFSVRSALHLPTKPSGPGPLAGVTVVSPPQCSHHCGRCTCVQATPGPAWPSVSSSHPPSRWCSRRPPLASRLPRPSLAAPLPCRSIIAWLTSSQCRGRSGQLAAGFARPGHVFPWARAGTVMGA